MRSENKTISKWRESNLKLKKLEVKKIVDYFGSEYRFSNVLELGAGNCSQSPFLSHLTSDTLFSVDLNSERLYSGDKVESQTLVVADAERLELIDFPVKFDLVFSSNMLEHLPNVRNCLKSSHLVACKDAYHVHILPNPTWRVFSCVFYYPVKVKNLLSSFARNDKRGAKSSWGNNIKLERKATSTFSRLLPPVHGISENVYREFHAFRRPTWERIFEETGYEVIKVISGPISTGYGLGFDFLKPLMRKFGISTEYIYILKRRNPTSEV